MKMIELDGVAKFPLLILGVVGLSVFVSESLVMLLLSFLPGLTVWAKAGLDASLLIVLISPVLYGFLFRPLVLYIRQQKCLESKLLQVEQEQFSVMLRTSLDGFWISDLEGHIVEVNQAYCDMLGYNRAELLSMHISDIETRETPAEIMCRKQKIVAIGWDRFETQHRCKNGQILDIEISTNYTEMHGGRFYCFLRNITDRKQAEVTLRQMHDRLTLATNAAEIGIWDWDIATNICSWDAQMCHLYDVSVIRSNYDYAFWLSRIHPDDLRAVHNAVEMAINGEHEFNMEFRVILPDASIRYISGSATVERDANKKAQRMIGINWDISRRKLEESALKQANESLELVLSAATGVGIISTDAQGTIKIFNQGAELMLGYSSAEVVDRETPSTAIWSRT
jgi:PAS domain S-box-containing protein